MLVLHALLVIFLFCVSLFVDARPRRAEDVREPNEARRQEQKVQELDEDIIVSEWRQVLTPTYSSPIHYAPSLNHSPSNTTTYC